jgi:hypothetical protein
MSTKHPATNLNELPREIEEKDIEQIIFDKMKEDWNSCAHVWPKPEHPMIAGIGSEVHCIKCGRSNKEVS